MGVSVYYCRSVGINIREGYNYKGRVLLWGVLYYYAGMVIP